LAIRFSSVIAILWGTLFLSTGQGLHQALISISAEAHNFDPFIIAILASVYFGGYLAGCFGVPYLIKRVGHGRTLAIAGSMLSAMSLAHILVPHEILWVTVRVFVGFCFASIDVVMESWLADRSEPKDRGKLLSVYRLIDLFSLGVGQFLIAMASPKAFLLFAIVAILVSIAVVIVSASVAPAPEPLENVRVRFWHVFKVSPLAVVTAGLHGIAFGIYWGFAPVFASTITDDRYVTGTMLAATLIGAATAQIPIGWAADRYDRRILIMWVSLAAALASLSVLGSALIHPNVISVSMFFFGATSLCIYPVAITYAFDRAEPKEFVEVGAAVLIAFGFGAFVGPLIAPLALRDSDTSGIFLLIGFVYLLIFGFALFRTSQTEPVQEAEAVGFIPTPATTPVTFEIDPRVDTEAYTGPPPT